jgi:hypothetical protein
VLHSEYYLFCIVLSSGSLSDCEPREYVLFEKLDDQPGLRSPGTLLPIAELPQMESSFDLNQLSSTTQYKTF